MEAAAMGRNSERFTVAAHSLAGIDFFRGLDEAARSDIASVCRGQRYSPRSEIVRYGDDSSEVYFVLSGHVQVTVFSNTGKVITFDEVRSGSMFGELAAVDGCRRVASVIAVETTSLIFVQARNFNDILDRYPTLRQKTMQRLAALVRLLCSRVFDFHALHVDDRIRVELLRLVDAQRHDERSTTLSPAPTHMELASRVGTNRESVTRELSRLSKWGVIERVGKDITVHDIHRLRELVGDRLVQFEVNMSRG